MKSMLGKYKIQLISSGILLSIIVSSFMINLNFSKKDLTKNQEESKTSSIAKVIEKDKVEIEVEAENIAEAKDNKVTVVTEDNIKDKNNKDKNNKDNTKKDIDKKNADINNSTNMNDKSISTSPITGEKYTVKKGDTLFLIAQRANISTNHLKQLNNLSSDVIYENQSLKIKGSINNTSSQVVSRGSERDEDLYWLSRIIHAEAQGESYEGKVAVGNVIINRVSSGLFPNTIKGVVFDKQNGYTQFSPVIDGTIYNTPNSSSIKAATDVLNGARPVGNALYFLNPRKSTNFWITKNRQYMKTIGLHDFYY